MRKVLVGVVLVGVGIALIPLLSRLGRMMREHCEQMACHCRDLTSKGPRNETVPAGSPEDVDNNDRRLERSRR